MAQVEAHPICHLIELLLVTPSGRASLYRLVELGLLSPDFTWRSPASDARAGDAQADAGSGHYARLMQHDAYRRVQGALRQVRWSG